MVSKFDPGDSDGAVEAKEPVEEQAPKKKPYEKPEVYLIYDTQDFRGKGDPVEAPNAFAEAQAAMFGDIAPQSASPEEIEEAVDRVASDLARRTLCTRTCVAFSFADRIRVLFGWRLWVYVETPYAPCRSEVSLDFVDFGRSGSDIELRAPGWWHRIRSFFRRSSDSDMAEAP